MDGSRWRTTRRTTITSPPTSSTRTGICREPSRMPSSPSFSAAASPMRLRCRTGTRAMSSTRPGRRHWPPSRRGSKKLVRYSLFFSPLGGTPFAISRRRAGRQLAPRAHAKSVIPGSGGVMKSLSVGVCAAVFLLATASVARAQGVGSVHFGISGGADFPVEDQSNAYKTGWNGTILVPINFGHSPVSIRFDGSYHRLDSKDNLALVSGSGHVEMLTGTFDIVVGPRGTSVEPYFIGGVGAYDMRFHGEDLENNTFSDTNT